MEDIEIVRIKKSDDYESSNKQVARIKSLIDSLLKELAQQAHWTGFGEGAKDMHERLTGKPIPVSFNRDKEQNEKNGKN